MKTIARRKLLLAMLCSLVSVSVCVGDDVAEKQGSANVRMPVNYDQTGLIVVSPEGVGAIRFGNPFGDPTSKDAGEGEVFGVEYEYRFAPRDENELNKDDKTELTGSGRVFSKFVDGKITPGFSVVRCKAASIKWSYKDKSSGHIEFDPRQLDVYPMVPGEFGPGAFAEKRPREPIDLNLFANTRSDVSKAVDTGIAPIGNRRKRRTVGAPIPYESTCLVLRTDEGIATFQFGEVVKRNPSETETRYCATYQYTFRTHDGETVDEGDGEVYELYIDNQYKGGELDLEAGPMKMHWSRGGSKNGWIYYDPQKQQVWTIETDANLDDFVRSISRSQS